MKFKVTNSHTLEEMARVGSFGDCEVMIYGKEGNIPHFHLYDKQTNKKTCIRIDKAEYFKHGDPKNYNLELNTNDRDDLVEWLNSYSDEYKALNIELSIYRNIVILWNQNNPEFVIDVNIEMPDYTKLA